MKGIFLTSTGEKESGYATVKRGIAKDPGSHIVWHVYALILRADKNFEEALKCYKKAVSIEPVSSGISTWKVLCLTLICILLETATLRTPSRSLTTSRNFRSTCATIKNMLQPACRFCASSLESAATGSTSPSRNISLDNTLRRTAPSPASNR